jgi:hypothetical protein
MMFYRHAVRRVNPGSGGGRKRMERAFTAAILALH